MEPIADVLQSFTKKQLILDHNFCLNFYSDLSPNAWFQSEAAWGSSLILSTVYATPINLSVLDAIFAIHKTNIAIRKPKRIIEFPFYQLSTGALRKTVLSLIKECAKLQLHFNNKNHGKKQKRFRAISRLFSYPLDHIPLLAQDYPLVLKTMQHMGYKPWMSPILALFLGASADFHNDRWISNIASHKDIRNGFFPLLSQSKTIRWDQLVRLWTLQVSEMVRKDQEKTAVELAFFIKRHVPVEFWNSDHTKHLRQFKIKVQTMHILCRNLSILSEEARTFFHSTLAKHDIEIFKLEQFFDIIKSTMSIHSIFDFLSSHNLIKEWFVCSEFSFCQHLLDRLLDLCSTCFLPATSKTAVLLFDIFSFQIAIQNARVQQLVSNVVAHCLHTRTFAVSFNRLVIFLVRNSIFIQVHRFIDFSEEFVDYVANHVLDEFHHEFMKARFLFQFGTAKTFETICPNVKLYLQTIVQPSSSADLCSADLCSADPSLFLKFTPFVFNCDKHSDCSQDIYFSFVKWLFVHPFCDAKTFFTHFSAHTDSTVEFDEEDEIPVVPMWILFYYLPLAFNICAGPQSLKCLLQAVGRKFTLDCEKHVFVNCAIHI